MINRFLFVVFVLLAASLSFSAIKTGGKIIKRSTNVGSIQEFDEGIRAMAGWYDCYQGKATDTGIINVETRWGDSIHVRGLVNNRDSSICVKMLFYNAQTDTNFFILYPYTMYAPFPVIWKFWVNETDNSLDSVNVFRQIAR